jgi:hypothetical protein
MKRAGLIPLVFQGDRTQDFRQAVSFMFYPIQLPLGWKGG